MQISNLKSQFQLPDSLPSGWEMRKHPSGRILFVDNKNQDTTWIDPRTGKSSDGKTEDELVYIYLPT